MSTDVKCNLDVSRMVEEAKSRLEALHHEGHSQAVEFATDVMSYESLRSIVDCSNEENFNLRDELNRTQDDGFATDEIDVLYSFSAIGSDREQKAWEQGAIEGFKHVFSLVESELDRSDES